MLITIYDSNRKKKADIGVNDSSTQVKEIHSDNVLSLSFTLYGRIELDVNDYVDFEGERYWLTEKYRPTQKSNQEWEYNVKLYGIESLIKRFLVLKNVDGENEPVFSLTAPARDHVAMIVECINLGMGTTDWKVGEVADTGNIIIDYEGTYCNEGLKKVAEASGTEWWFDGMTVNVCRCEHGEELALGYGNGILSIEPGTADNVKFYTRLFPTGSTRNIDPSRYGHSRLQLPGGIKYVDVNTDKYGIIHHYEQDAFSHIYPKRIGTISGVRSEKVTDEDGNPFTVYYFKDSGLDFDPNSYEIAGLVKQVTFQNGELNGREFEVNFNSETKEFEIITIWPYDDGTQLPGGLLVPESGDEYILWNIRMPDEYYPIAETEYLTAVNEYNAAHGVDVSVYKCPTDHVWVEDNGAEFYLGRRVRLESSQYFPETGYRSSRITKITRRVNLPSYVELEISDAVSKGGMENIEDSIDEVRSIVQTSNASIPDIIRSWERTPASDYNLFSALKTLKMFLRKDQDDRTPFKLNVGDKLTAERGIQIGESFVPGILTGSGGFFDEWGNGEVESLIVRRFLEVPDLRYNRVQVTLGDKWNAPGAGVVERVVPDSDTTGTVFLKLEDGEYGAIAVGDICMGIFHSMTASENATEDSDDSRGNFQYAGFYTCYFTITEITGKDNKQFRYQMRPVNDRWKLTIHPRQAMTFVCYGSFTDPSRQTSSYTTRTYYRLLKFQNTWEISEVNIAMQLGDLTNLSVHGLEMSGYSAYLKNIYMTGIIRQFNESGVELKIANDRGAWLPGTAYAFYDRVSHDGCLWLCVNESGTNTEPSKTDPSWLKQVDSGSGITSSSHWNSNNVPYKANTILNFADKVWISNKMTSEPPFPIYTDNNGNRLTYNDGGYILVSPLIQSEDWDLLLDVPDLTNGADGADGASLYVRYSADGTNWHDTFTEGDIYMQQRVGLENMWSDPIRIVGEDGLAKDGRYADYQFAVNDSDTVAPVSSWQDAPPPVESGQYLWMRMRIVDPNEDTPGAWSIPVRLKGDKGDKGDGITPVGAWKSGMIVPALGVVTMGGRIWVAKAATTNPPLWCYTDSKGNYLLYNDGGYILTGECNTEEYDLWVSDGIGSFVSTVFIRSNSTPATPTGGSYDNPVPTGWSDGIPSGTAILWASTCVFRSDGTHDSWSKPSQMTDTANFDVEYSSVENPSAPAGHPNTNPQWSNTADKNTIWMATSTCSNGVWSNWSVSKIKGETGGKGDTGDKGDTGIQGCIYRQTEWVSGTEYHNDTGLTSGLRYIDIVTVTDSSGNFSAYECKSTHTAGESNKPGSGESWQTCWTEMNSMQPIYTPLLFTKNAVMRFGQANQLLVLNDGGNVMAGLSGGSSTNNILLWVGGTPANAPFTVDKDGNMVASKATISGTIIAEAGSIGGFNIGENYIGSKDLAVWNNALIRISPDRITLVHTRYEVIDFITYEGQSETVLSPGRLITTNTGNAINSLALRARSGNYMLEVTGSGIRISKDGGVSWTYLKYE